MTIGIAREGSGGQAIANTLLRSGRKVGTGKPSGGSTSAGGLVSLSGAAGISRLGGAALRGGAAWRDIRIGILETGKVIVGSDGFVIRAR